MATLENKKRSRLPCMNYYLECYLFMNQFTEKLEKKRCLERKFMFLVITEMHCETDNDFFVQKKQLIKSLVGPR